MKYSPIPEAYKQPAARPGRIEKLEYTHAGAPKTAYVYLPAGYDGAGRYDVVYFMHGGGDLEDAFMGTDREPNVFKNVLDQMIERGELRPLLAVSPSYYPQGGLKLDLDYATEMTALFPDELTEDLIPAVESKYASFAESTDPAGQKASRDHRAFGGFSMGSCAAWFTFMKCLDSVATFFPLSGDCWAVCRRGGESLPAETAAVLDEAVKRSGWGPEDFRIFAATGTEDSAYLAMTPMFEAMKKLPSFRFSDEIGEGNLHYTVAQGREHVWESIWDYLYDYLRLVYPAE